MAVAPGNSIGRSPNLNMYNLKGCFECKRKKMCGKTADLWRIICLLRWAFVDLGKFILQKPSISSRHSTGYHSHMYHNKNAFSRPCLSSFIDPWTLAIQSNTRWKAQNIEPACLTFTQLQLQAAGGSMRHVLKIARRLFVIADLDQVLVTKMETIILYYIILYYTVKLCGENLINIIGPMCIYCLNE